MFFFTTNVELFLSLVVFAEDKASELALYDRVVCSIPQIGIFITPCMPEQGGVK